MSFLDTQTGQELAALNPQGLKKWVYNKILALFDGQIKEVCDSSPARSPQFPYIVCILVRFRLPVRVDSPPGQVSPVAHGGHMFGLAQSGVVCL